MDYPCHRQVYRLVKPLIGQVQEAVVFRGSVRGFRVQHVSFGFSPRSIGEGGVSRLGCAGAGAGAGAGSLRAHGP